MLNSTPIKRYSRIIYLLWPYDHKTTNQNTLSKSQYIQSWLHDFLQWVQKCVLKSDIVKSGFWYIILTQAGNIIFWRNILQVKWQILDWMIFENLYKKLILKSVMTVKSGFWYIILTQAGYIIFWRNIYYYIQLITLFFRGCHGHDHMVVGFTTAYAISAYHH